MANIVRRPPRWTGLSITKWYFGRRACCNDEPLLASGINLIDPRRGTGRRASSDHFRKSKQQCRTIESENPRAHPGRGWDERK